MSDRHLLSSPVAGRKSNTQRHHSHGPVRLPLWQLRTVYWSFGVLSVSGLVWLALHALAVATTPLNSDNLSLPSPAKAWALRIHAASALAALIALGSVLPLHVRTAWHRHKSRTSGSVNLLVMSVLTLTGYALWYASEGGLKEWSAWLHWALGCVLPLALVIHIILGRRARA